MSLFLVAVGLLMWQADYLAHKLQHPSDKLGLIAARKANRIDTTQKGY